MVDSSSQTHQEEQLNMLQKWLLPGSGQVKGEGDHLTDNH